MAGLGAAPKPQGQRRRYNAPARGDWVTLPPPAASIPAMPQRDDGEPWSDRCRRAWVSWWLCPSSGMWREGEASLLELALEQFDRASISTAAAGEFRQLADRLGITEKGRRDLRWKVPDEDAGPQLTSVPAPALIDDYRRALGVDASGQPTAPSSTGRPRGAGWSEPEPEPDEDLAQLDQDAERRLAALDPREPAEPVDPVPSPPRRRPARPPSADPADLMSQYRAALGVADDGPVAPDAGLTVEQRRRLRRSSPAELAHPGRTAHPSAHRSPDPAPPEPAEVEAQADDDPPSGSLLNDPDALAAAQELDRPGEAQRRYRAAREAEAAAQPRQPPSLGRLLGSRY